MEAQNIFKIKHLRNILTRLKLTKINFGDENENVVRKT